MKKLDWIKILLLLNLYLEMFIIEKFYFFLPNDKNWNKNCLSIKSAIIFCNGPQKLFQACN